MKFLSYESKFSQTMLKACCACVLNALWFFCSIPVFTMGAATAALYHVTFKLAKDEDPSIVKEFFRGFKNNFKQATVIWLIMFVSGLFIFGDVYILYHLYKSASGGVSVFWTILLAISFLIVIIYTIVLIYIFPLVAKVENTTFNMFKNSLLIGIRYLFCTILVFAIYFAMFFIVVAFFTPIIIFGMGLCALISSYLLSNVFALCTYDPESGEEN